MAQLARHFRQLQQEDRQLRSRLRDLQQQPVEVQMLVIGSDGKAEPLIMRGQIFLRLASLARAGGDQWQDYHAHVEIARADFDRAIHLDRKNPWAWLGKGDVQTWLRRIDDATASHEQALLLNPLFDIARQRLIDLTTAQARRQAKQERWEQALTTLNRLLDEPLPESWIPEQKEGLFTSRHSASKAEPARSSSLGPLHGNPCRSEECGGAGYSRIDLSNSPPRQLGENRF